jgi:hypothetical protein
MTFLLFKHREDFGHEWYIQFLNTGKHVPKVFKNWSLFQASVSWNEFPSWPYIKVSSGTGSLLSVMFWVYKFGFDAGFIERTWIWDQIKDLTEDPEFIKIEDDK